MAEKTSLQITLPTTRGFRRLMFFNRFAVENDGGFVLIHFGLVNKQNAVVDSYSTAISAMELEQHEKAFDDYLGKQGTMLEEPPSWQPPVANKTELANHIVMARHGPLTETALFLVSFWAAMMESKQPNPNLGSIPEGVALLRSPLAVQQHLIKLIFRDKRDSLFKQ